MYKSIWIDGCHKKEYPSLDGDRRCGVLIVGGGMAGILAAHFLKEAGVDCLVAEGGRIGMGVTGCTTAFISAHHELAYSALDIEVARIFLAANQWAVEKYRKMSKDIDCDFEDRDCYVYSLTDTAKIEKELRALADLGYKAEFVGKLPLPLDIKGAYKFWKQAQFHPLKFLYALAEKLDIVENTYIREIKNRVAYTDKGNISADKIIIATHFPFINSSGFYFVKMYQQRSYVLALDNAPDYNGLFLDQEANGMYFRNYKNYLLVGGGDHRTGKKGGSFEEIRNFAKDRYPESIEKYHWATQDCIPLDGMPYVGRYSKTLDDVYVSTGFNEWGMTGAMIGARVLCELITGKESEYAATFAPDRCALKAQLFCNLGSAVVNLIDPTPKRCPHLGCGLKYNPSEHTWDCPCHGSRFDEEGKLLDNPAIKNAHLGDR